MAAGYGGARPGAGRKKGGYNTISAERLRIAIEGKMGMSYEQVLAEMQQKLFQDFTENRNVKECIMFTENMSKRLLQMPVQEMEISNPLLELTKEQIEAKIAAIVATGKTEDEQDASEE